MSYREIVTTPSPSRPDHEKAFKRKPVSRSGSLRSKGIGLNIAVSPIAVASPPSASATTAAARHHNSSGASHHLPQVPESHIASAAPASPIPTTSEVLRYDIPLPPAKDLFKLDMEDQLRLLALKEMSIVEIKDSINTLQAKLTTHEAELHKLREVIQRSLYNEINDSRSGRRNSNPRDEAIANAKNRTRRRTLSLTGPSNGQVSPEKAEKSNSLWANLSKPLNLIQQFDSMLQNEFEKSLIPQQNGQGKLRQYRSRASEDSSSSIGSLSPLRTKSRNDHLNLDDYLAEQRSEEPKRNTEEMFQAVSSSLWSFMNDVRANMLSAVGEDEASKDESPYTVGNNSNASINKDTIVNEDDFDAILKLDDDEETNRKVVQT